MVRDRVISTKFWTHRISAECTVDAKHIWETIRDRVISTISDILATFYKNRFPAIFGGHLEFLRKMQKLIYLENEILAVILNFTEIENVIYLKNP